MRDEDRFKLLYGPYHAPRVRVGQYLYCEMRGQEVKVRKWHRKGHFPVPMTVNPGRRCGAPTYIVYSDLARALRVESWTAVRHWWGVSRYVVTKWRRELGVPAMTEGSRALSRRWANEIWTDEVRQHAVELAAQRSVRLKAYRKWREGMQASAPCLPPMMIRRCGPEAEALLGTMADARVADKLGVPAGTVRRWRNQLRIPPFGNRRGSRFRGSFILSTDKMATRRLNLDLTQAEVARHTGISQYQGLENGSRRLISSQELARIAEALRCRPEDLVDDSVEQPPESFWTPEINARIGTVPDIQIARELGCFSATVGLQRQRLGLPPFNRLVDLSLDRLRQRRLALGLSRSETSHRAGRDAGWFGKFERGDFPRVTSAVLERLASVLQCRAEDLMDRSGG